MRRRAMVTKSQPDAIQQREIGRFIEQELDRYSINDATENLQASRTRDNRALTRASSSAAEIVPRLRHCCTH